MKTFILNLTYSFISILRIIKNTRKLTYFFPIKQNDDVVLIGNGPSFKDFFYSNMDFFTGRDSMCVNDFVNTDYYEQIRPNNYLIIDPVYYQRYTNSQFRDRILHLEHNLNVKTKWKINFFIPAQFKNNKIYKIFDIKNNNINICYFNSIPFYGFKFLKKIFFKYNIAMPFAQNVLVAGLYILIMMSYRKIFIVGADHSWHTEMKVNDENILLIRDKHFYNDDITYSPWFKNFETKEVWKVHEIFYALGKMFEGYHEISEFSTIMNTKIYNLTKNSFIDAFERKYQYMEEK